jgi:DNA-binding transcriptional regulator YbjK
MRVAAVILIGFASLSAVAQDFAPVQYKEHPSAADVAIIFRDMALTIDRMQEPAAQLAATQWNFQRAEVMHNKMQQLKSMLQEWIPLLDKQQMPAASDLYTAYTLFRDTEGDCEILAQNADQQSTANAKNATVLLRSLTSSVTLATALDPAVYDAILKLERQRSR